MKRLKNINQQTKSAPYLDNIETACLNSNTQKTSNINGFCVEEKKKLYSQNDKNNNSHAIIDELKKYKNQSVKLAQMLIENNSILIDRAEKMLDCGNYVEVLQGEEGAKIGYSNFCRQRICPTCQRRRSLKVGATIAEIKEDMQEYEWVHLILTVPNCTAESLEETIKRMYKTSSEFFKDKRIAQGFKGVIRCLEVTYKHDNVSSTSKDDETHNSLMSLGTYHPHLHCLCAVRKSYFTSRYYLDHDILMWKWIYYYGADRLLQVHATKVKDDGAVAEVAKYCVKPLELDLEDDIKILVLEHLFRVLHGRRLIQTYGEVKETSKRLKASFDDDDLTDEPISYKIVDRYLYDTTKAEYHISDSDTL